MVFFNSCWESQSTRSHPSARPRVKLKDGHTQHIFWSQSFEQFGIRSCQDRSGKPKTFQLAKGWATFYAYIHSLQCRWCSWCNGGLPSSLRYSQVRLNLKSFVTFPDTVKSHGTTHRLEPYRHLVGKRSEDPRDASKKTETSTLRLKGILWHDYHPLILASCFKTPGFETTEGQRLRQFMREKQQPVRVSDVHQQLWSRN